jgi:glycosyltransferase involved in cell wall biosynthesis
VTAGAPHVLVLGSAAEDYGADRMLLRSVAALVGDLRVTVVLPVDGPLRGRLEDLGADVRVLADFALRRRYLAPRQAPGLLGRNLSAVVRLARLHRRDPVDLVLTNTAAVVAGSALAAVIRRPHVWHVHEVLDRPPAFARVMARLIRSRSDRVIACSQTARDRLVDLEPALAERTVVVLNGIPLPDAPVLDATVRSPRQEVASRTSGGEVVRVGCVGRIHPRKGQRELVEAWVRAVTRSQDGAPRLELHLFGDALDGGEHLVAELHARIDAAGLTDQAHLHGFVGDPASIYGELDLVVVPSVQPESFSLVCAEAHAHGLPVIAPDGDGPTEIVVPGETGLLVDPTDPEALAGALCWMAEDGARRSALGAAGRSRAAAMFSLERYQEGVRAVVDSVLAGRSSGGRATVEASR